MKSPFVLTALLCTFAATPGAALPERPLPFALNDGNTHVEFEVDSTWHMVHGQVSGISGTLTQSDPANGATLASHIEIPVAHFNTDNSMRDSRLREVMAADRFPAVVVDTLSISASCLPEDLEVGASCSGILDGTVRIRDFSQAVKLPYRLVREQNVYTVAGDYVLRWRDFGVEDPSIFIAKLKNDVHVHYQVRVPY